MAAKISKFFAKDKAEAPVEPQASAPLSVVESTSSVSGTKKRTRGFRIPGGDSNSVFAGSIQGGPVVLDSPPPKTLAQAAQANVTSPAPEISPPKAVASTTIAAVTPVAKAEPASKVRRTDSKPPPQNFSVAVADPFAGIPAQAATTPAVQVVDPFADIPSQAAPSPAAVQSKKGNVNAKTPAAGASAPKTPSPAKVGGSGLPLEGVVMCFTGELDQMTRADAEEKCKAAGAKVMSGVSGNTNYLVIGSHLDDGRKVEETSKYKKYLELKEKGKKFPTLLDEAQLLALLPGAPAPAVQSNDKPVSPVPAAQPSKAAANCHANWVDSHAPENLGEVLGNASIVKKLTEWLHHWDDVVLRGNKRPVAFKPGGGVPENPNARAALVSGPPGIGKTTTCTLVAKAHGAYEVLQYNASDARGQKVIQEMADGIADNRTLSWGGGVQKEIVKPKRVVIIMDEVDGMGAGDRGGNAALIKMIKKTKNPIICICNDQQKPTIRSLAFSCYDLKFSRPTKTTIAQRCAAIAAKEGLQVEPNALEMLAESCGNDMRMVLNQLQMLARAPLYQQMGVKYMDMKEKMASLQKDQALMLTPFEACKKLLSSSEGKNLSFNDRLDLFFVDHSLVGLLIQENYLNAVSKRNDLEIMNRAAYSADLMTVSDLINSRIRDEQDWSLLPDLGVLGAVYPAQVTNGFLPFPSFPQFLGKFSNMQRMRRLATELQSHLQIASNVKRSHLLTSGYADLLYRKAITPLQRNDSAEGVHQTFAVLDAYGLRREHLSEHLTELRQHLGGDDLFKTVDSKVKAALTRESNSHAAKVVIPVGKKRKATGAAEGDADELGEDDEADKLTPNEDDGKSDEDDDVGSSSLIKKGKAKAKAKGKATKASSEDKPSKAKAKAKSKGK
eukprot:gnl/TRDRNA2_/TRDRNA2_153437_c5_seq3.p1 gnl/TRDRNA2_/TRDRNA2_153437_c5~~gnl/TRDRNA2_/TRDRNA2_153437_c5_seq3.p1  ORF type:complete len:913 (+),score=207.98 gnl/TRDRNA2_/TRDRNA2_153437_c5_seq3:54-2741(+)